MPPQREHGGRVEGITLEDFRTLQRQMHELQEQMHIGMNLVVGDDESKDEREVKGNVDQAAIEEVLNPKEVKPSKAISNIGKRLKFDVPRFLGNLNPKELIDWINELEEYFEYEDIEDLDRVKFVKAKLKGHAKIL